MKQRKTELLLLGSVVLFGLLLVNMYLATGISNVIPEEIDENDENISLEITKISVDCEECFSVDNILSQFKDSDIIDVESITELDRAEAIEAGLIEEYEINRLPNIIIEGDTDKIEADGFLKTNDVVVLENIVPPFVDANTGNVKGTVELIEIIDTECEVCQDMSWFIGTLEDLGVAVTENTVKDINEIDISEIDEYGIDRVPAIFVSNDVDYYEGISENLLSVQFEEIYNGYLLESQPPFRDIESGNIRGKSNATLIDVRDCPECYDVEIHAEVVGSMLGEGLANIDRLYVDEASEFVSKYNITEVPTVVIDGDLAVYDGLKEMWEEFGTVEADGSLVFRELHFIGEPYYDLEDDEITQN